MTTETIDSPPEKLHTHWQTVLAEQDVAISETILRTSPADTTGTNAYSIYDQLPRLDADRQVTEFDIKGTIGQGGMGLVRLARQRSLGRDVAIKTLLPDRLDAKTTRDLLRESWVTGGLEHPNIVPIYTLGVDEHDAPMLVMKRIEGISWRQAIEGSAPMPTNFRGAGDELEDDLQILIQVCNAVQFAHSKDIIHCDLKPENIMLGDYGEVYLLDWGVAVSIADDAGRLPRADDVSTVCGTPAYIAPELAEGDGTRIGKHTDVYLLGAILHRIVTGDARHCGETVMATLINAYQSAPVDYDDSVPPELAAICNQATQADPAQRFSSVEAFREAILEFLEHRESRRLSDEAKRRLRQLQQRIQHFIDRDQNTGDDRTSRDPYDLDELRADVYRLGAECRFGFEQALAVWETNQSAHDNLQQTLRHMIEFELYQRDHKAAALLMDELTEPAPQFERRLQDLRQQLDSEAEEIERNRRIIRDVDISLATRQRSIMCVLLGFLLGAAPLGIQLLDHQGWVAFNFQSYFAQFGLVVTGSLLIVATMYKKLFQNAINARLIASIFIILGGCFVMRIAGVLLGLDPGGCIVLENGLLAFAMAMLALSVDDRLWPAGIAFLTGAIAGAVYPAYILPIDGASNAAALWIIAFIWYQPASQQPISALRDKP